MNFWIVAGLDFMSVLWVVWGVWTPSYLLAGFVLWYPGIGIPPQLLFLGFLTFYPPLKGFFPNPDS